jgi:hypothetical protein
VVVTQDELARGHLDVGDDVTIARRRAASFGPRPDDPTLGDNVRTFVRRYGWRAYALPVLIVITVAALLTARSGKPVGTHTASGNRPGATPGAPPVASASIALKSDAPGPNSSETVLKAAALPAGGAYTVQGTGAFSIVKGTGKVVGSGPLHRYTIEVENGITGVNVAQFVALVQSTLADPRSWSGHGVSLQRVDSGPVDFRVSLTSAMTVRTLCGYDVPIETSCFAAKSFTTGATVDRVVLNVARWVRGDANYIGDLTAYRQYMINHEDGHALGHMHAHECLADGLAPTMMQQTFGLRSAATGKMCQANPWPYPRGAADAPGAEQPDTSQNNEYGIAD